MLVIVFVVCVATFVVALPSLVNGEAYKDGFRNFLNRFVQWLLHGLGAVVSGCMFYWWLWD